MAVRGQPALFVDRHHHVCRCSRRECPCAPCQSQARPRPRAIRIGSFNIVVRALHPRRNSEPFRQQKQVVGRKQFPSCTSYLAAHTGYL